MLVETTLNPNKAFIPASSIPVKVLNQSVLEKMPEGATIIETKSATILNRETTIGYDPSYQAGTKVYTYVTPPTGDKFVRVFVGGGDSGRAVGGWVLRESDIKGLTPQQIQDKFSLPQTPTTMVDVSIPADVKINGVRLR